MSGATEWATRGHAVGRAHTARLRGIAATCRALLAMPTAQRIWCDWLINPHGTATRISAKTTPIHANPESTAHRGNLRPAPIQPNPHTEHVASAPQRLWSARVTFYPSERTVPALARPALKNENLRFTFGESFFLCHFVEKEIKSCIDIEKKTRMIFLKLKIGECPNCSVQINNNSSNNNNGEITFNKRF